jgi:hypothetical protein
MRCSRSFLCYVRPDSHVKVGRRVDRTGAGERANGAAQSGPPAPANGAGVLGIPIRSLSVWWLWRTEEMSECWSVGTLECWNVGMRPVGGGMLSRAFSCAFFNPLNID